MIVSIYVGWIPITLFAISSKSYLKWWGYSALWWERRKANNSTFHTLHIIWAWIKPFVVILGNKQLQHISIQRLEIVLFLSLRPLRRIASPWLIWSAWKILLINITDSWVWVASWSVQLILFTIFYISKVGSTRTKKVERGKKTCDMTNNQVEYTKK